MTIHASEDASTNLPLEPVTISELLPQMHLLTEEQIRRFELLRLAFFTLKLRKLEQRMHDGGQEKVTRDGEKYNWHCSLLRHAIFQQVITLTKLDARQQAFQLIDACRK